MQLEDYWGIGPKTRAELADALGVEAAAEAIERADVDALVDAGLAPGRVTRILRHVHGGAGMDVLATRDARLVYKDLVDRIADHAVSGRARNRINVLTPLTDVDAMEERLDRVTAAVDAWRSLDGEQRAAVLDAFETGADGWSADRAGVETALALRDIGVDDGPFAAVAALDGAALEEAADALAALDDDAPGSDELAEREDQLAAVDRLSASGLDLLEELQSGAQSSDELREAFVSHVARETGVDPTRVREATPADAADAAAFVSESLRTLQADLRETVDERESAVRSDLEETLDAAGDEIDAAREAVAEAAFDVSLARFWLAYDCVRPRFSTDTAVAVAGARNLTLDGGGRGEAGDRSGGSDGCGDGVQPVTYGVGRHGLDADPSIPEDDRVSVLTGANSGGKTTLLETLCQCTLLAYMGLGVPADAAEIGTFDAVVFHRRHASFNAGVLESTLKTIVPPLARGGEPLMLVDEFEAITEPGRAADILNGLVQLTVDADTAGVFVTHLADELAPLPDPARIDGISAEGLAADLTLEVDYQPRFGTVGESTPEFIVSRLLADADDREEHAGYRALAESLGQEAVQQTLADVEG